MKTLGIALGIALTVMAPVWADDAPARAHEIGSIAKVDGSKVHWIQGEADVTLPAGWTLDDDTGKKDTDLQLQNGDKNYYLLITTADSEDYKMVGDKMVEGMSGSADAKDPKKEPPTEATVAGFKAQRTVFATTMNDTRLKYAIYSFAANGRSYILTAFSGADAFDAATKDFDAIGASFKIAKDGAPAATGAVTALEGTWDILSMNIEAKDVPADAIKGMTMTVAGTKYTLQQADKEVETGTIKVDGTNVDWNIESGGDKGKLQKGLFKVDGANLTIANAQPGADARPGDLTTKAGQAIVTLKKK